MNKQQEIAKYLTTVKEATTEDVYKNVPFSYYCNELKHTANIISRMVKNGKVTRIKPGLFKLSNRIIPSVKIVKEDKNQLNLF